MGSKDEKVESSVRCCGVSTFGWITPPGPEKIACSVCGEEFLAWA